MSKVDSVTDPSNATTSPASIGLGTTNVGTRLTSPAQPGTFGSLTIEPPLLASRCKKYDPVPTVAPSSGRACGRQPLSLISEPSRAYQPLSAGSVIASSSAWLRGLTSRAPTPVASRSTSIGFFQSSGPGSSHPKLCQSPDAVQGWTT